MDFLSTHNPKVGLVLSLLCLIVGCDTDLRVDTDEDDEATETASPSSELPSDVAAVVNGHQITSAEVEEHLDKLGDLYRHSNRNFDESIRRDKRRRVVQRLIDRELLHRYAADQNVAVDARAVDRAVQQRIDAEFGSTDAFRRYLDAHDTTVGEFRQRIQRNLVIDELISVHVDAEAIDEQYLRRYYDRIANRRPADERVHAFRLTIDLRRLTDDDDHRSTHDKLLELADHIDSGVELQQLGDELDDWLEDHNLEARYRFHAPRWYERNRLRSGAADHLFDNADDPDSASIVDTTTGFDVYWVLEQREAGIRQFDEVEHLLRERAHRSKLSDYRRQLIDELRADADITIDIDDSHRSADSVDP